MLFLIFPILSFNKWGGLSNITIVLFGSVSIFSWKNGPENKLLKAVNIIYDFIFDELSWFGDGILSQHKNSPKFLALSTRSK